MTVAAVQVPRPGALPGACRHCSLPIARCRSCGAEILWALSENESPYPLDARVTTIAFEFPRPAGALKWVPLRGHVPHHITCPQGREWRR